jgi:hypothetical protein
VVLAQGPCAPHHTTHLCKVQRGRKARGSTLKCLALKRDHSMVVEGAVQARGTAGITLDSCHCRLVALQELQHQRLQCLPGLLGLLLRAASAVGGGGSSSSCQSVLHEACQDDGLC